MYEDNGIYLWWMDSYWYIGNDPCQDDYAAAYVYDDDADLVSLTGTWTEYQGSSKGWRANADVAPCRVDTPAPTPATPEPTPGPRRNRLFSDDAQPCPAVDAGALALPTSVPTYSPTTPEPPCPVPGADTRPTQHRRRGPREADAPASPRRP